MQETFYIYLDVQVYFTASASRVIFCLKHFSFGVFKASFLVYKQVWQLIKVVQCIRRDTLQMMCFRTFRGSDFCGRE